MAHNEKRTGNPNRGKFELGSLRDRFGETIEVRLIPFIGQHGTDYGDLTEIEVWTDDGPEVLHLSPKQRRTLRAILDSAEHFEAEGVRR